MTTVDWAELIAFVIVFIPGMVFVGLFWWATRMPKKRKNR